MLYLILATWLCSKKIHLVSDEAEGSTTKDRISGRFGKVHTTTRLLKGDAPVVMFLSRHNYYGHYGMGLFF